MSFLLGEESSEILKESYSDYLQQSQVFPKLLEILEKLQKCEEKPQNPMDFIREGLGDKPIDVEEIQSLEQELDDANNEIRRLQLILNKIGINYDGNETLEISFNGLEIAENNFDDVSKVSTG